MYQVCTVDLAVDKIISWLNVSDVVIFPDSLKVIIDGSPKSFKLLYGEVELTLDYQTDIEKVSCYF